MFHLFHPIANFPGSLPGLVLWVLLCLVGVLFLLAFAFGEICFLLHPFQLLTDNVSH